MAITNKAIRQRRRRHIITALVGAAVLGGAGATGAGIGAGAGWVIGDILGKYRSELTITTEERKLIYELGDLSNRIVREQNDPVNSKVDRALELAASQRKEDRAYAGKLLEQVYADLDSRFKRIKYLEGLRSTIRGKKIYQDYLTRVDKIRARERGKGVKWGAILGLVGGVGAEGLRGIRRRRSEQKTRVPAAPRTSARKTRTGRRPRG